MLMVTTLRSASAGAWPFGASQSRPARLPAPDVETTSKTMPRSAKAATAPAISAILGAPPPSTSAVRARFSLRSALRSLFAARFALYRLRLGGEATCSDVAAEVALVLAADADVALFLAMAILLSGLLLSPWAGRQSLAILSRPPGRAILWLQPPGRESLGGALRWHRRLFTRKSPCRYW